MDRFFRTEDPIVPVKTLEALTKALLQSRGGAASYRLSQRLQVRGRGQGPAARSASAVSGLRHPCCSSAIVRSLWHLVVVAASTSLLPISREKDFQAAAMPALRPKVQTIHHAALTTLHKPRNTMIDN